MAVHAEGVGEREGHRPCVRRGPPPWPGAWPPWPAAGPTGSPRGRRPGPGPPARSGTSAGPMVVATPRWVAMVRSASPLTSTRQRPVPSASASAAAVGRRRRSPPGHHRVELDPRGPDVVGEHPAQRVVGHLARRTRRPRPGRPPRPWCWPPSRRRPRWSGPWRRRWRRPGPGRPAPSSPAPGRRAAISSSVATASTSTSGEPMPDHVEAPAAPASGSPAVPSAVTAERVPGPAASLSPMPAPDDATSPDAAYRLPRTVEPCVYRLTLGPDLDAATFTGSVEIDLAVHEPVGELVCNAAELAIADAVLERPAAPDGAGRRSRSDEAAERATFAVDAPLPAGPATLRCSFAGTLNDKLRGFYRSTFTDDDGRDPHHRHHPDGVDRRPAGLPLLGRAGPQGGLRGHPGGRRRAWPPSPTRPVVDRVAPRRAAHRALRPDHEDVHLPGGLRGRAPRRPPTRSTSDGVPVRVVHVPGKAHLTPFALEVAAHALRFFADYFAIPYPADKLDLVAIPDFAFGAMENLGCVTFRETALLVDPDRGRPDRARAGGRRGGPRDRPHVVRRPGHHGLVGGHLAERGLRHLHGGPLRRRLPAGLASAGSASALEREAALAVDGLHATRPIEYPVASPDRRRRHVRRPHLREGRQRAAHARALPRAPRSFRDGVRALPDGPRLRQHRDRRPVGRPRGRERRAGPGRRWTRGSSRAATPWSPWTAAPVIPGALRLRPRRPPGRPRGPGDRAIGPDWQVPGPRPLRAPASERLLLGAGGRGRPPGAAGQRRRLGRLPGRLRRRTAWPELAADLAALDPLERCNLLADTWALVLAGAGRARAVRGAGRRAARRRRATTRAPGRW